MRFILNEPVRFTPYIKGRDRFFLLFQTLSLSKTQTLQKCSHFSLTFAGNVREEEDEHDEGLKIPAAAGGCAAVPESKTFFF